MKTKIKNLRNGVVFSYRNSVYQVVELDCCGEEFKVYINLTCGNVISPSWTWIFIDGKDTLVTRLGRLKVSSLKKKENFRK